MSAPSYEFGNISNNEERPHWPPTTGKELINWFAQRESVEGFDGFSVNAAAIDDALDSMTWTLEDGAKANLYLPLEAGSDGRKVYKDQMTPAHAELFDSVYTMTNAKLVSSEIDDNNTEGKVWWRGEYQGSVGPKHYPMNFVEIHSRDEGGEYVKWQLVSSVPDSFYQLAPPSTVLHPTEKKWMFKQVSEEIDALADGLYRPEDLQQAA